MTTIWAAAVAAFAMQGQSLQDLEQRVRADSNDALLHYQLGVELARLKRTDEARRTFETAVRIDPKLLDGWIALSRVTPAHVGAPFSIVVDGNRWRLVFHPPTDSSRHISRRIFLMNPLVDADKGTRYQFPTFWAGTLRQAMRAYRAGKWELATAWFDTVIIKNARQRKDPDPPPVALWYRALAQIELARYDTAIADLRRLLAIALRDSTGRGREEIFQCEYALAYVHQLSGSMMEAARAFRELVEANVGLDIGHMYLANALDALGRIDEAVAERRNATNANPDDPSLIFDLGVALQNAGHSGEAEEQLHRALAANPRETRAYFVLGAALQAQGKTDQARDAYQRFLELSPRRYQALITDAQQRLGSP